MAYNKIESKFTSLNYGWSGEFYFIFIFKSQKKMLWEMDPTLPVRLTSMNWSTSRSLRAVCKTEDKDKLHSFASLS